MSPTDRLRRALYLAEIRRLEGAVDLGLRAQTLEDGEYLAWPENVRGTCPSGVVARFLLPLPLHLSPRPQEY